MIIFLLGCLCGFVVTVLILFLYASLRVGGDRHE